MVINLKNTLTFCLILLVFSDIFAQKDELSPNSKFDSHTYDPVWVIPSPDMKYITFQKNYEYSSDTLVLISPLKPEKILFQTSDVHPISVKFSKKGYLFMSGVNSAKLIRLSDLKPIVWNQVRKSFFMAESGLVAILTDKNLKIYNEIGIIREEIPNVESIVEKNDRIFYTLKNNDSFTLFEYLPLEKKEILSSGDSVYNIMYLDGEKMFIQSVKAGRKIPALTFIDRVQGKTVKIENPILNSLISLAHVSVLSDGRFFLTISTQKPVAEKSSDVDIWYANDNQLEKKFLPKRELQYAVWDAQSNEMVVLNHNKYNKHTDPGNGRYLLAFDQYEFQNYTAHRIQSNIYRYDTYLEKYDFLGLTGLYKTISKDGKYLLSHDNENWNLYDISSKEKREFKLDREIEPYFSSSGNIIIFPTKNGVYEYNILNSKMNKLMLAPNERSEVAAVIREGVGIENYIFKSYFDTTKPLLIKVRDDDKLTEFYAVYQNSKLKPLSKKSSFNVSEPILMPDGKSFLYLKGHYNIQPSFVLNSTGSEKFIFKTNPDDKKVNEYKSERISYKNSKGVQLTGLLYYPRVFNATKKYPMVVGIYEVLRYHSNRYLRDGFKGKQTEGLNIRYYSDRGYYVFLPDIVFDERGTGRSALDCVESAMDALATKSNIDFTRVGLLGHSHGGYETNFIATQSKKFAAFVGGAGNTDLVRSYNSFNYDYSTPFYWQFEEQQYRMFKSFYEDKELYIDNSPVYHADKVSSPILLWTGTKDENIEWEQSMEFYLGLRRNNKKVIALFYEGDNHSLQKKVNREDLFVRISEWFDYHLKGEKKDWIDVMYN